YAGRLTQLLPAGLPGTVARTAHASVGAALTAAGAVAHAGQPGLATGLHDAAANAFFHGFTTANYVAAGVALAGAAMALALLPAHPAMDHPDAEATSLAGVTSPPAAAA